jgi:hypothetical protein
VLRLQAGEGGSSTFMESATADRPVRWQNPSPTSTRPAAPFQMSMGRETTLGVPAKTMHPMMSSDSAISWTATFEPFAAELPVRADWIHFGKFAPPGQDVDRIARNWTWADEHNAQLGEAIPGRFVRGVVIKNANNDLVLATAAAAQSRRTDYMPR